MSDDYCFEGFSPVRKRMRPFIFDINETGRIVQYNNTELSGELGIELRQDDISLPVARYIERWDIGDGSKELILSGYDRILRGSDDYFETESDTAFFRKDGFPLHVHLTVNKRFQDDIRSDLRDESTAASQGKELKELQKGISHLGHDIRPNIMRLGTDIMELRNYMKSLHINDPAIEEYFSILISGVRDFSETAGTLLKITTGTYDVQKREIDMYSDVIIPSLKPFFADITEKDIKLDYDDSFGKLKVISDPRLLKTIASNYVSNAARHTPPNGRITWGRKEYEGEDWFNIYNTGNPIPDDLIDKIFTPGIMGDDRTIIAGKPRYGIGLSSAKSAAKRLGEKVWAEKGRDEGANFFFSVRRE